MSSSGNHFMCTKRLNIDIRGSLKQFDSSGAAAATWTPLSGKITDMFGVGEMIDNIDNSTSVAALQNATLHRVVLLEVKNDHHLGVGVKISCCPNDEVTRNGDKFAFTCLPRSHNTTPHVLFEADTTNSEGMQWRSQYPQYNSSNLETEGVLQVQGELFVFVSNDHPVIDMLRKNAHILNADISQQPLIDGKWYKIAKQVMSGCCSHLRERVLSRIYTRDLTALTVQLQRLDGKEWTSFTANDEMMAGIPEEIQNSNDPNAITSAVTSLLTTSRSFHLRLELVYDLTLPGTKIQQ